MKRTTKHFRWRFFAKRVALLPMALATLLIQLTVARPQLKQDLLNQRISIEVKNRSLTEILTEIEKKAPVKFVYSNNFFQPFTNLSLSARQDKLQTVLDKLFRPLNIGYQLMDKGYIILKKPVSPAHSVVTMQSLLGKTSLQEIGAATQLAAEEREITGTVTTADTKEPLPGVNVMLKGTATGVTTDGKGNYRITVPEGSTLVFSFVGYTTEEIPVGSQTMLDVTLVPDVNNLNEVVVVGYGTQKKENLTGAVDQVTSEVIENRPIANLGRGLQGVIPNLNITFSDGQPGKGPRFNIRGTTSINGGEPLILVDGIPTEPDLVNPNDIDRISVLKDAASAAIYGARGAFGVILIETKSGSKNKMRVSYTNNFALNTPTILPKAVKDPYASMNFTNEANKAYTGKDYFTPEDMEYARQRSADPSLPAVVIEPGSSGERYKYFGSTDWFKEMYRPAQPQMQHNLSVSGGSEKITYFLSGGYLNQNGIYRYDADQFKRYNFRTKLGIELTKWLTLTNNLNYSNGIYEYPTFYGNNVDIQRYVVLLGAAQYVPKNPDGTWTYNGFPVAFLQDGGRGTRNEKLLQNTLGFRMSFLQNNWEIIGNYTYQNDGYDLKEQYKTLKYSTQPGQFSQTGVNRATNGSTDNYYHVFNLYSSYQRQLGLHYLKGMVGFNQELRTFSGFQANRTGLISDLSSLNLAAGDQTVDGSASEWAIRGLFYRLNYQFNDKYLLELNGRYDGTSRFPRKDRFGFFPSISAGWRISEEGFFAGAKRMVDQLKLRASYGTLGNQLIRDENGREIPYPYIPGMSTALSGAILGGVRPLVVNSPGLVSPTLTWEKATTLDFGLDATVLNNRLDFTFDWYIRHTRDMLTKGRTLPAVLGTTEPRENAADLRTEGWELSVKWRDDFNLFGKPFDYDLGVVLSDYQARITRFDNPNGYLGDYYVGQKWGEIWGLETEGFFQSDDEIKNHANQTAVMRFPATIGAGDLKFKDRNGDGKVDFGSNTLSDPGDRLVIGNSTPRYSYGANGRFSWNNFTFSFFLQGIGRKDYYPGGEVAYFWSAYNRVNNTPLEHIVGNYWTPENPDAYYPRLKAYIAFDKNKELGTAQTRYLQRAAYLRLKNLTLGYTIPTGLTRKMGVERLQFYVSGENLWERTRLVMPVDPEALNASHKWGDGQTYPFQRTYSAGLNVTF